jgi:hypothetical protein
MGTIRYVIYGENTRQVISSLIMGYNKASELIKTMQINKDNNFLIGVIHFNMGKVVKTEPENLIFKNEPKLS